MHTHRVSGFTGDSAHHSDVGTRSGGQQAEDSSDSAFMDDPHHSNGIHSEDFHADDSAFTGDPTCHSDVGTRSEGQRAVNSGDPAFTDDPLHHSDWTRLEGHRAMDSGLMSEPTSYLAPLTQFIALSLQGPAPRGFTQATRHSRSISPATPT